MALLKEFLLDINKKISIPGIEALAGASDLAAIEIDDDTMTQATTKLNGLMSIDAAKNTPELADHFKKTLHPIIKGELLGNIDTDVASTVKNLFGDDAVEKLKEKEFTGDKIKYFGELAKTAIESKDTGDVKIKELNTNLNKQIIEINQLRQKDAKDKDKEISKIKSGFTETLIKKEFSAAINTYNLGDKYQEDFVKSALHNNVFKEVQKVAKLTLSEEGNIVPKNPTDEGLELFVNGTQQVSTLKDILDPLMKPYVKANNVIKPGQRGTYTPSTEAPKARMAIDMIQKKAQKKAQMN